MQGKQEQLLDVYLGCAITALFGAGSWICNRRFADPVVRVKRRAWIISACASGFCFAAGVAVSTDIKNARTRLQRVVAGGLA